MEIPNQMFQSDQFNPDTKHKPSPEELAQFSFKSLIEELKDYRKGSPDTKLPETQNRTQVDEDALSVDKAARINKKDLILSFFIKFKENSPIKGEQIGDGLDELTEEDIKNLSSQQKDSYIQKIKEFADELPSEETQEENPIH